MIHFHNKIWNRWVVYSYFEYIHHYMPCCYAVTTSNIGLFDSLKGLSNSFKTRKNISLYFKRRHLIIYGIHLNNIPSRTFGKTSRRPLLFQGFSWMEIFCTILSIPQLPEIFDQLVEWKIGNFEFPKHYFAKDLLQWMHLWSVFQPASYSELL